VKRLITIFIAAVTLYLSVGYWFFPNSHYPKFVLEKISFPIYSIFKKVNDGLDTTKDFCVDLKLWLSSKEQLIKQVKNSDLLEDELQITKIKLATLQQHFDGLKAQANFVCSKEFLQVSVPVYGMPVGFYESTLVIGAPLNINVAKNSPVVTSKGLVGRVIESSNRILKVLLVTDADSKIPVKVLSSKENAIAVGNGNNLISLEHLQSQEVFTENYKQQPKQGDVILTSGVGGIYPPDIPVGIVWKVTDSSIIVKPLVEFNSLNVVAVLYEKLGL
jgi:rod shape-determining protein MreC